jgi:Zn ribbon nucleic-acid-binding protein
MTNSNCLKGLSCPKCGQHERLIISGRSFFEVTDSGSEAVGDHEWDDESLTSCPACHHTDTLHGFRLPRTLPPDPEGMNDFRADWAEYALAAFVSQTGADYADAVTDLLCDLMHLADREGTDFAADLERARMHYAAETRPNSTDDHPITSSTSTKGLDA